MSGLHRRIPRRAEQLSTFAIVVGSVLTVTAALIIPSLASSGAQGDGRETTIAAPGDARPVGANAVAGRDAERYAQDQSAVVGGQPPGPADPLPGPTPSTSPTTAVSDIGESATSAANDAYEEASGGDDSSGGGGGGGSDNGGGDDGSSGGGNAIPPPDGWPDAKTTGYRNAPGFPGSLSRFSGQIQSNTTYKFLDFSGGVSIGSGVKNVTFIGCRFTSNAVADATVPVHGDDITFSYSTFEPSGGGSARTVNYRDGYQYAIDQRSPGKLTVENSDFWGWGNGIQFAWSTKDKPVVVRDSWFHHARTDGGGVDHTDAILESYGGPSYMVFDHNTIVSEGNTNGLALQGPGYSNVTVTRNYFSGFGYTVSLGVKPSTNRNMVFTGNTFGTDIKPGWGPLYGWSNGNGNLWRQNKWRVAPGGFSSQSADDGKFWWPTGSRSSSDYSG